MKIEKTFVILCALLLVGCDAYVSPSIQQATINHARYDGWMRAMAEERDESLREVAVVRTGQLAEGEEVQLPLDIKGIQAGLIIAACDRHIATPVWLPLASVDQISVGMQAFTMGFPSPSMLGSTVKFTKGSITALSGADDEMAMLQVSVPIQPGNSGGPLLDWSGRVLGVIESSIDEHHDGSALQVVNFARHAQVASLLTAGMPIARNTPPFTPRSREQLIEQVSKAVCQVRGSRS